MDSGIAAPRTEARQSLQGTSSNILDRFCEIAIARIFSSLFPLRCSSCWRHQVRVLRHCEKGSNMDGPRIQPGAQDRRASLRARAQRSLIPSDLHVGYNSPPRLRTENQRPHHGLSSWAGSQAQRVSAPPAQEPWAPEQWMVQFAWLLVGTRLPQCQPLMVGEGQTCEAGHRGFGRSDIRQEWRRLSGALML
jgi:hypothetical protein